ncbi:hypothetical protein SNEBB_008338 [Seison nebaliae]|nr:hypothetical protein SNEBB_008338 [Seison nebaliae]
MTTESVFEKFSKQFSPLMKKLSERIEINETEIRSIGEQIERFHQMLHYNVPKGKRTRGITVLNSVRYMMEAKNEKNLETIMKLENFAIIAGWAIELLQAFFLITDDIMDASITRRGQPCWYKRADVGMIAINDALLVEQLIYELFRQTMREEKFYLNLIELFHETTLKTVIGQSVDTLTPPTDGKIDFTKYTEDTYSTIVKWKTAFYSFYLPVASAMYIMEIDDKSLHEVAKNILLDMGHYFQVQDDYLDCFGHPDVIGKIGTDIQDNKCSWLCVEALKRMDENQKKDLLENYGRNDEKNVEKVKELYGNLKLEEIYFKFDEDSYERISGNIKKFISNTQLPEEMFTALLEIIAHRKK